MICSHTTSHTYGGSSVFGVGLTVLRAFSAISLRVDVSANALLLSRPEVGSSANQSDV